MPSKLHEAIVEMLRGRPDLVLSLLRVGGVRVPDGAHGVATGEGFSSLIAEFRADFVVKIEDSAGALERVVVVEVQLNRDEGKIYSLPVYQALARARLRAPCEVVVVAPDASVAAWLRHPIRLGGRSVFRAIVLGPEELGFEDAAVTVPPELWFLRALDGLPEAQGALYWDLILANLSEPTRRLVEALMLTDNYEEGAFRRMMERVGHARGRAEGRTEGRTEGLEQGLRSAIRLVLEARGVTLDEAAAKELDTCTDLTQLETWARRAAHANDARDLFTDTPPPR